MHDFQPSGVTLVFREDTFSISADDALVLANDLWSRGTFRNARGAIPLSVELTLAAKQRARQPVRLDTARLKLVAESLASLAVALRLPADLSALQERLLRFGEPLE